MATVRELLASPLPAGTVTWLGLRPGRGAPVEVVDAARAEQGRGLTGDRWSGRATGRRQVTLIQAEHLPVIAALLRRDAIDPAIFRRNLVVSGINLLALKGRAFRIGDAVLEGSGACAPCSKMESALGVGGFAAMRGHGGITARVVQSGWIRRGDAVVALPAEDA
jgi:MOSC domain-containing protein YiiM